LRNSAVTELGYQLGIDIGIRHHFANLAWDHELAAVNRLVTAIEPEIPFAPAFSMPPLPSAGIGPPLPSARPRPRLVAQGENHLALVQRAQRAIMIRAGGSADTWR
jgi:hypothetical protein